MKIKEQKRNKAMNLTTKINKVKKWLEHVCKPLTHVEWLEAILLSY